MRSGVLVFLVLLAVQFYLIGELVRYLQKRIARAKIRQALLLLSVCFFILMISPLAWRAIFGFKKAFPYFTLASDFYTVCSIWWMGSVGCALVLGLSNLLRRLTLLRSSQTAADIPNFARRDFLRKGAGLAAAAPFVISGYGGFIERRRFEIEDFTVSISGLTSSLSQLRIVQLSDIHLGPFLTAEELAGYVDAVNRLRPDLVAITGDFVTSRHDEVSPCVEELSKLKARYGTFACLGNHDIYAGVSGELTRELRETGISMLRNEAVSVQVGNTNLGILGIDDLGRGRPNFQRAAAAAENNAAEVNILLSHRPEIFPKAAQAGIDLVLSGHYHGGQVKLTPNPDGPSIARLMTVFPEGLFTLPYRSGNNPPAKKQSTLFVSRGIGITALPIRINCPPQIAQLTLRKA